MRLKRFLILFLALIPSWTMAQDEKVTFSASGGFYNHSFYLTISCNEPSHHIRYTTNGNAPTVHSALYDKPLFLDERLYSNSDIYKIQISPDDLVYIPDSVKHAIVIRAAAFDKNGKRVSETVTNTYLICELDCGSTGFAALSICADSLDLFDHKSGIMVPGKTWDASKPNSTGNYYQKGKEWERKVNLEFYEPDDNSGINQACGLRTHGNLSRRCPAKGMKVYARNEYGKNRFEHAFFGNSDIDSFKHLVLKPFATFWPYSGAQDYFCCTLAHQLELGAPHCRPILVYLNGEYWGVYFLQEKMDERYLEDHYGLNEYNCNIIGSWNGEVEHGNDKHFKRMMRWLKKADLSDETDFRQIRSLIDLDNFIDYMVFQTFVGNWDWPHNNMRCWQEGDGPWHWLFFDGDATIIQHDFDVFANASLYTEPTSWYSYPEKALLFGKLLENDTFKTAFISRAKELCNSLFRFENTSIILHEIIERLAPAIDDQRYRFGYPLSMVSWEAGNALIEDFLQHRVEAYLKAIDEFPLFKSGRQLSDLNNFICFPNPTNGTIHIKMTEEWDHPVSVQIYNVNGHSVFYETFTAFGENTIVINKDFPAGMYVIRIGSIFQRLIIF